MIESVPHFSLHNPSYFWAMDPAGYVKMKEETYILLGLPMLEENVMLGLLHNPIPKAVSDFLKLKGFDPLTLDYAHAHNLPIFNVMPNLNSCGVFEDMDEESNCALRIPLYLIEVSPFRCWFSLYTADSDSDSLHTAPGTGAEVEEEPSEMVITSDTNGK